MLKLYTNKILLFMLTQTIFFASFVDAKEPMMAILLDVKSNDEQILNIGKYSYYCKAYGVISIDELVLNNSSNEVCLNSIKSFYKKNLRLKYFSLNMLKIKQSYHIEFKDKKCVLYSNGQKTLSQKLLENGLVILKSRFKDREFKYSFVKAQNIAKNEKRGIWSENIPSKCLSELSN